VDRPIAITVAVCTYNRAHLLQKTLESLAGMRLPPALRWDLLVVDNNCTDGTVDLCASYRAQLPIRVVSEALAGISHARNRALLEARGDYLVFIDDDVRVLPEWLDACIRAARRYPDAAAFGGPIEPDFPEAPDPDLVGAFPALGKGFCGLDHARPEGDLPGDLPIWTANTAYRLEAISGLSYDPRLGRGPNWRRGGEEEAFLRLLRARGGKVIWVPDMRVRHYVDPARMTLKYLISFQIGAGEEFVYQNDWASQAGTTFLGVPPWLALKTMKAYGRYLASRRTLPRAVVLKNLSRACYYFGMLRAVRAERAPRGLSDIWHRAAPAPRDSARAA
jgi:glycosyltransferase involved in cell wall biosynthesis